MRIHFGWLLAAAVAYGVPGGWLLEDHIWNSAHGLDWSPTAHVRIAWATLVSLSTTVWLARRERGLSTGAVAAHAFAAFLLGAAASWGVLELLATQWQHPWDAWVSRAFEGAVCLDCPARSLIIRQTMLAVSMGLVAVAAVAPLVAWVARRSAKDSRPA